MAEGLLYRRRVWTRQPTGPAKAAASSLASGLCFLAVPGQPDSITHTSGVRLNNGSIAPGPAGTRLLTPAASTDGYYYPLPATSPLYNISSTNTVLVLARVSANSAFNNLVGVPYRSGAWASPYYAFFFGGTNPGTSALHAITGNNSGIVDNFILASEGLTTFGVTRSGTAVKFYRGGTQFLADQTIAGASPDFANKQPLCIFVRSDTDPSEGLAGSCYLVAVWNRALSAVEIAAVHANPWQLFAPANSPVFYSLPGGGINLTVAGAQSSHTLSTGAVTQEHALSAAGASNAQTLSTGAIGQVHVLAAAGMTSAHLLSTGVIEIVGQLVAADAQSSHTLSAGAVTQTHQTLSAAGARSDPTLSVGAIEIPGQTLASGGWDFFLRPIRHRDPPESLPEARKAVKDVVRKARKLRDRADELAEEAAHLARQSEQRERVEATIAELRAQSAQYEQIATQYRIHVELLIEQQREDDDLEIMLLAA